MRGWREVWRRVADAWESSPTLTRQWHSRIRKVGQALESCQRGEFKPLGEIQQAGEVLRSIGYWHAREENTDEGFWFSVWINSGWIGDFHIICLVPHYTVKGTLDWPDPVLKIFLRENHIISFNCFFKDIYWCIGASLKTTKTNRLVGSYNDINTYIWFAI